MKRPIEQMLRNAGIPVVEVSNDEQSVTKPGVWVRSFLKSKGRQWPVVFIPAINDRDVPDTESIRKGEVESIRRRLYVAMTRAKQTLVFSYVRGGDDDRIDVTAEGDVIGTNGASRFLFEAGLVQPSQSETTEQPVIQEATSETAAKPNPITAEPATIAPEKMPEAPEAQPEKPEAPKPTAPAAPKKRVMPKKWEPYVTDTRNLTKARSEWESGDHDNAIFCAWKPIEKVLVRLVKFPAGGEKTDPMSLIDEALVQGIIDMDWKDRLHLWRRVRNQAIHDNPTKNKFTPDKFRDYGFQLIDGAPEFFTHLAERNAPQQMMLETQDEFLIRLGNLVTQIQHGSNSPVSGKPLKAIRFNPEQDQFDILAMQLLMVLRDVRFYVPEEFRWSSSTLISKFSVSTVGYLPTGFRTLGNNRLKLDAGEQQNQLMSRFNRMILQECGDVEAAAFLHERLSDALALENGNFHSGLKLNPRSR